MISTQIAFGAIPTGSQSFRFLAVLVDRDIVKSLYGLGEEYISIPVGGHGETSQGIHPRPTIKNAKGEDVSLRRFADGECRGISGVIFAAHGIWNSVPPWTTRAPGDEFVFVHNATADVRLPHGLFPLGQEWLAEDGQLKPMDHRGSSPTSLAKPEPDGT